jgi:hypothetical protein
MCGAAAVAINDPYLNEQFSLDVWVSSHIAKKPFNLIFADLIKQISGQGIRVKMIFTGIGRSISDLMKVHN